MQAQIVFPASYLVLPIGMAFACQAWLNRAVTVPSIHLPRQEIDLDPQGLAKRSHSEYVVGKGLVEMIQEDFVAERIAIESW